MKLQVLHSSRSGAVAALIVAAVFASLSPAKAQNATVFRSVVIDVTAIPAGAEFARVQMRSCLARYIPAAFAGRISGSARGAPVLVVRPMAITLVEGDSSEGGGGGGSDILQGEAVINGSHVPLLVTSAGGNSNDAFSPSNANRRVETLCSNFAYWLARKI